MRAVVDNDVLSKGAAYRLLPYLVTIEIGECEEVGILGAAQFVIPKKIAKAGLNDAGAAVACFAAFISKAVVLEPTGAEQQLAAQFELAAQKRGLNLHAGESQLCAIVLSRNVPMFLTGDKQAIMAIENLLDVEGSLMGLCGRLRCLEQIVIALTRSIGLASLRCAICAEPNADLALSICFSCAADHPCDQAVFDGLESYIRDVRARAGRVLPA